MKKLFALILAGALAASSLTACGSTAVVAVPQPEATTPPAAEPARESTPESSGAAVKTGFYLGTDISGSKSAAAEEAGMAQANLELVAVTLTDEGVIDECVIDAIQSKINFDATGAITTDLTAPVLSKNALGDDYGMKKASAIGKEWYEQAAAFSAYVVGKTPEEVSGIAVNEKGGAADADLAASVTISIGQFQALVAKAGA